MRCLPTFEVRIPTCDRPKMLRRALVSLQSQSYPHWHAIIFDDSSSSSSRDVVENIGDNRISYARNPRRLGAAGNIDQCFSSVKSMGGDFACLLEDDNFWLSEFLATVVDRATQSGWELVLANQRIYEDGVGLRAAN